MLSGGHNRGLMWPPPPRSPSLALLGVSELAASKAGQSAAALSNENTVDTGTSS